MIRNHYVAVDLVSRYRIERSIFLKVKLDHLSFVRETTLYYDRVLHELIGYPTLEVVRNILQISCLSLYSSWGGRLSIVRSEIVLEPRVYRAQLILRLWLLRRLLVHDVL